MTQRSAGSTAGALAGLRVQATVQLRLELGAPWGARVPPIADATFLAVAAGRCRLEVDGAAPLALAPGSFVFIRPQAGWVIRDSPATPPVAVAEVLARYPPRDGVLAGGGGGERTCGVLGCLKLEASADRQLVEGLAPVVHFAGGDDVAARWLDLTVQLLARTGEGPGAETLRQRLGEALTIQVVRSHLASGESGWLGALVDPRVARAVELVHARPREPWTVGSLAACVGMSRTVFATRFATLVGEPPLAYLGRWRLQTAARMLREGDEAIAAVADRVGYTAEAAFSRAFKRWAGVAPGDFRRRARSGTGA